VEGLPQNPSALGAAAILLGLVLGAVYLRRALRRQSLVTVVVASLAIAAFPYVAWRVVEDIRYTSGLDPWLANRYGVSVFHVHPAIFDNAERHMRANARFYLASSPKIELTRREAFRQWAVSWMLPHVAVTTPSRAQYVLTLGMSPRAVGVPIARVWRVMPALLGTPAAYLGEVAE
jgi:hypothetical protein